MITLYNKAYTVAQAQPSVQSYYGLKILIIISDNNILHLGPVPQSPIKLTLD